MKKIIYCFLILSAGLVQAQTQPRQILQGQIIADSIDVVNVSVQNVTSNKGAVTDEDGKFTMYARPTDTLYFSSITFRSLNMVLKEEDLSKNRY